MILDEMPSLGHMEMIEQILSYGRGYGINLMVISQTIELIQKVYPKSWQTFLSNQLSVFFGCTDPMTYKLVSEMLGSTTVETKSSNTGKQIKSMDFLGASSLQSGISTGETGRPLLMPNEIKMLGNKVVLAFLCGEPPILCQRIDYRERLEWKNHWNENPLHINRK